MLATKSDLDLELEHLRLDTANLNVLRKLTRAQERRVHINRSIANHHQRQSNFWNNVGWNFNHH